MGVTTHWGGYGNGGTGGDRGIYFLPPEHGHIGHCDPYYHGLVFDGRADAGNVTIQAMVGADHPGYNEDQGGAGRLRGGEGDRG